MNEEKLSSVDDLIGSNNKFFEHYRSADKFIFDETKRFTGGNCQ